MISNLHVTVQTATGYLAPLLVGAFAGPAATGLFKIARDVATTITRPAELLNASVYPEFARFAGQEKWSALPRLIVPFKRNAYLQVVEAFKTFAQA